MEKRRETKKGEEPRLEIKREGKRGKEKKAQMRELKKGSTKDSQKEFWR